MASSLFAALHSVLIVAAVAVNCIISADVTLQFVIVISLHYDDSICS
jgi:hypothetical protein